MSSSATIGSGADQPSNDVPEDRRASLAEARDTATEAVRDVRATVRQARSDVAEKGADLLHAARDHAEGLAEQGKRAGAEHMVGFARAIHRAADELDPASPQLAVHVHAVADAVGGFSGALRERSAGELLDNLRDFAQRQPLAVFGFAALVGFGLTRFGMSSAKAEASRAPDYGADATGTTTAPGWIRASPDQPARPATIAAASLGGAAAYRPPQGGAGGTATPAGTVTP